MEEVSTLRILAHKALQEACGQDCVDWATSMLVAGHDGHNLTMLASSNPPYNHFELADLRDQALVEIGAPVFEGDEAILAYAKERLRLALEGEANLVETLRDIKDYCVSHDYLESLYDFYLLYHAYDSLQGSTVQWYWDGANRDNILDIIRERAEALDSLAVVRLDPAKE